MRRFAIEMSHGSTFQGTSEVAGKTDMLRCDATHIAHISILADEE